MPIFILTLLKKFWLPIVCVIGLLIVIGGAYYKGRCDMEAKYNKIIIEEQLKHQKEVERLLRSASELKNRITKGVTDEEASCILSNNPFKKDCLK